jgi:glycosyltransferase involved in cell wall biosynthesis
MILYVARAQMDPASPNIAVVVPAYNEEESIRAVVADLHCSLQRLGLRPEVIVVNDGSTDGTVSAVRALPCVLLSLPFNVGKGAATQLGFRYTYARNCEVVVVVDADGQHPANEIGILMQPLLDGSADVVIGSRFLGNGGSRSSFGRRIGISYFNALQGLLLRRRFTDSTSGFRAMNRKALALCIEEYPDQYPEPEAIVMFTRRNLRVAEVAVHMNERRGGQSSIGMLEGLLYLFRATLAMLMTVLRTHH